MLAFSAPEPLITALPLTHTHGDKCALKRSQNCKESWVWQKITHNSLSLLTLKKKTHFRNGLKMLYYIFKELKSCFTNMQMPLPCWIILWSIKHIKTFLCGMNNTYNACFLCLGVYAAITDVTRQEKCVEIWIFLLV